MFDLIQEDLDIVFSKIENTFQMKAGHISRFIPDLEMNHLDRCLLPALVILPGRLYGGCRNRLRVLAAVVQYIMMAQFIHNRIPDDCPKEVPQFPVLIGDYLFSKFFQLLSQNDLLEYLSPLSQIICEMNEGGIIRREVLEKGRGSREDYLDVVRREYGMLAAQCCRMGGAIANTAPEVQDSLAEFGLNLAVAWEIKKNRLPLNAGEFLQKARGALEEVIPGPERDVLAVLVQRVE